jgi:hypothetical protein
LSACRIEDSALVVESAIANREVGNPNEFWPDHPH